MLPILYRATCASCGLITVLPLDILQTQLLYHKNVKLTYKEFKWLLFASTIFTVQNTVYSISNYKFNNYISSILAGISSSPFYIFLEYNKIYLRFRLIPEQKIYFFIMTMRQIFLYTIIYNFKLNNITNIPASISKFITFLLGNSIAFIVKMIALKTSYPTIYISWKIIKKVALLEIIKTSACENIAQYLTYNYKL